MARKARKRLTRSARKEEILRVLRRNSEEGGDPLSCRQIAQEMNMRGYGYVSTLLIEMCDDGEISVDVKPFNSKIASVRFAYYV